MCWNLGRNRLGATNEARALHTGLSQQAFAVSLGISISSIAKYEKDRVPSKRALAQFSQLAKELKQSDLGDVFENQMNSGTMRTRKMNREIHNIECPVNQDERMVVAEALCLYRNRDLIPDWKEKDSNDLAAMEYLLARSDAGESVQTDRQALRDVAGWSRSLRLEPPKRWVPVTGEYIKPEGRPAGSVSAILFESEK